MTKQVTANALEQRAYTQAVNRKPYPVSRCRQMSVDHLAGFFVPFMVGISRPVDGRLLPNA